MEDEQKTLQLVKDVADVLERIAANSSHTPALYSNFLRALISAKLDSNASSGDSKHSNSSGMHHDADATVNGPSAQIYPSNAHEQQQPAHGNLLDLNEFQFHGEMGPAVDISTFPPTMAANPSEDTMTLSSLAMENILSSNFWDNVLVTGRCSGTPGY